MFTHPAVPVPRRTLAIATAVVAAFAGCTAVSFVAASPAAAAAGVTPPVGTVRQWLGNNEAQGTLYRKDYTLRAVGGHDEIWVANDTSFPAGDCRGAASTVVSDAQAQAMAEQFDATIYPVLTGNFSTPPDRDGSNAQLGADSTGAGGDYSGDGGKTVVLVDNIRDDNYYSFPAVQDGQPGFFSSQFNELFDRNVVTVDAFDWAHRTGVNPPDATTADPCTSRPARPRGYERSLTRSFQELIHYYADPDEETWVVQGMSGLAERLTGYLSDAADSDVACFRGLARLESPPRACGGPENSLTAWGDQGAGDLAADRGAATSFVVYLRDRFGPGLLTAFSRSGEHGLTSLAPLLAGTGATVPDVLHDFSTMVLVDRTLDAAAGTLSGIDRARVTSANQSSTVDLDNPEAYAGPGVPVNAADYLTLRGTGGTPLAGQRIETLNFDGAATLAATPLRWSVVTNDPDRPGNPALFSGNVNSLDESAVTSIAVPTTNNTLTFLAKYGAEVGYDYGYVEISTDGGVTYTAIAGDKTVDGPDGPGLNGTTNGFEPHSFDLRAYAGRTVLLALRYVSDGGVNEGGLLVDDIRVGSTLISDGSSLAPFTSRTQASPVPVAGWNLRLVGLDPADVTSASVSVVDFAGRRSLRLTRADLTALSGYRRVVAIVSHDNPGETYVEPADYSLTTTEGDPPPVNHAPVPTADRYTGSAGRPLVADGTTLPSVLANDVDADGDALTAAVQTQPVHGTVALRPDGTFTYTPTGAAFVGTDSFTYTATDGRSDPVPATVTLALTNTAPTANADAYSTTTGGPTLTVPAPGVLGNDTDVQGDRLSATRATTTTNGTVTLAADGSFSYTPRSGFSGTDSFTYTAADGRGGVSAPATVTITVRPAAADVSVRVSAPATAVRNRSFTVTLTVGNAGPSTATSVASVVAVPEGMRITAAPGGVISNNQRSAGFLLASLAPGGTKTYTVTVTSSSPGTKTIGAATASLVRDPATGNNSAGTTTRIT